MAYLKIVILQIENIVPRYKFGVSCCGTPVDGSRVKVFLENIYKISRNF